MPKPIHYKYTSQQKKWYKMKPTNPNAHAHDKKLQNRDYERTEKTDKVCSEKCDMEAKVWSAKVMRRKV